MIKKMLSVLLSVLVALHAGSAANSDGEEAEMSLYAINVRKADALLLRSGKSAYLIDTGTEDEAPTLLKALKNEGISHLDGIILTHTDKDHIGGLEYLLNSDLDVDQVYASGYFKAKIKKKSGETKEHPVVKILKGTGRELIYLLSGDSLPLDGGTLEVLGPLVQNDEAENCNSVVLLATGGGGTMLLTGDMEFPEEETLLSAGLIPHADVLKIGNHGEDDATSEALIKAVAPSVAVISTNTEDEPDTPSGRVMKLLQKYKVTVYQTQETENGVLITLRNGEIAAEKK